MRKKRLRETQTLRAGSSKV